jgi:AcrR family transcriptional regulator
MTNHASLRSDAMANRERLIASARLCFAERGLAVEMKEIAERAGVGVGTIYRNFSTKEDLIESLIERIVSEVMPRIDEALALDDPLASVTALLDVAWSTAETHGSLIERLQESGIHPAHARAGEFETLFEEPIRRGVASGVFRDDIEPKFVATFLFSAFPAYLQLRRSFPADAVGRQMSAILLGGICAQPPRGAT